MSAAANWSYTAKATLWKRLGVNEWGKPEFSAPVVITCDYGGDGRLPKPLVSDAGQEVVIKNTIWTEYADAALGDFALIGESSEPNPLDAGADEVKAIIRYADTFDRVADDFTIVTGA
ncbi:hypothetical protein H3Z28_002196 [Salmonella enterica subsp. enterica serovar Ank]|nr:hypothetical protein [Salmonella enterica subsp. enterica serovar Ank]EBH2789584.1 hypothetical protein [Salmonella enterica subsp. enterica serovar Ank]EFX3898357.1 hypothetical protein [Salmonella enterica subsp. enterica serovar Ank]EHY9925883.1 hypothetical protein [Salmonella enterica subsp. enterica serovar Ank]